jgi:hypothetical protein
MSRSKIENKHFQDYRLFLFEKSRPPSKGGNTKALHTHVLTIDGERYSFFALGSQQWAHKSDLVSFEYDLKDGYKNIVRETFVTVTNAGEPVVRGNRGFKAQLRTADARMPGSRREQRD